MLSYFRVFVNPVGLLGLEGCCEKKKKKKKKPKQPAGLRTALSD